MGKFISICTAFCNGDILYLDGMVEGQHMQHPDAVPGGKTKSRSLPLKPATGCRTNTQRNELGRYLMMII